MADQIAYANDQQNLQNHYPSLSHQYSKSNCFNISSNTLEVEKFSQGQGMPAPLIIRTAPASPSGKHPLYRGIRSRSGKWVSEIREPRKTTRIWLGTYPTPEMAAAAYDAASLLLKGADTALNFPIHMYGNLLLLSEPPTAAWIRVAAANAAASRSVASQSLRFPEPHQLAQDTNITNVNKEEYVDEEEVFDMPNLLMAMAEGMLVHPPSRITISPPISDDSEEESLWSYRRKSA
ncbi:ethylene-responsive transcription factor ERF027-like [Heracleum sosnowskyi]|uniref:Ethylene-responsive transcription factor ERF027-like n=1 Tax=Heracleum sosnowskyi TaxID=360622 RepID=A0AAD8N9H9_9APIA|nr:ethylene-responsive transcription factor ERF027-like [Heracleum sosnowskyi]